MKKIGKIKAVKFGMGGYDDSMVGISFQFSSDGRDSFFVQEFWGTWLDRPDRAEWTQQDQINTLGKMVLAFGNLLNLAKKNEIEELVGVPVEVEFDVNSKLSGWRILTEAI